MKVFVTGGSGFVGEEVLRQLHQAGHDIRLLARNPAAPRVQTLAASCGARIVRGDVTDSASLAEGLPGSDAVIHLVGIISEAGRSTFENVHVRGTQNVIQAAQASGVKRLVHISALGTRVNGRSRYHQSKWAAEEAVRASRLDYTIFRPSIIYGPRDQFVNLFARMARFSPVMPIFGDGRSKLQPVSVANVGGSFVRALGEVKSLGQTYDLCGADVLTFEEVLDVILEVTGRKRWILHVPMGVARCQAALFEWAFALIGKASPLNRDQLLMLAEDNVGNPQPANELFGLELIRFKAGIASYLKRAG